MEGLKDQNILQKMARPSYPHNVLSIDAVDGNSYIIEISGAQFGYFKAVTPFDDYLLATAADIHTVTWHGSIVAQHGEALSSWYAGKLNHSVQSRLGSLYDRALNTWEQSKSMTMLELTNCIQKTYVNGKGKLLGFVGQTLSGAIERWKQSDYQDLSIIGSSVTGRTRVSLPPSSFARYRSAAQRKFEQKDQAALRQAEQENYRWATSQLEWGM